MSAKVYCDVMRNYDKRIPYLVMLTVGTRHACISKYGRAFPTARAVMDDFGTLIIVGDWS